jgi:hypothetical protein
LTKPKPKNAREALWQLKGKGKWTELSIALDKLSGQKFAPAYLHQVAHGKRRASDPLLKALGLPLNAVPVQPCAQCGELHDFLKTCPKKLRERHAQKMRPWKHLNELSDAQITYLLRTRKDYSNP